MQRMRYSFSPESGMLRASKSFWRSGDRNRPISATANLGLPFSCRSQDSESGRILIKYHSTLIRLLGLGSVSKFEEARRPSLIPSTIKCERSDDFDAREEVLDDSKCLL